MCRGAVVMRQEHLFCAEVFHRLYDRIDHTKRKLFCLDGSAAKQAASKNEIECETIPDLCFTFVGADREIRIEAKILESRRIKLSSNERAAWCRSGTGKLQPDLWVAADEPLRRCWKWEHKTFCEKLDFHQTSKGPVLVFPADQFPEGLGVDELVEEIVRWAEMNGFHPRGMT
jgi:hypothetical protein